MSKTTEQEQEQSWSEQQAWMQLASICEMVAKLTREGAAREFVKELSRERCIELLNGDEPIDNPDRLDDEKLREMVFEGIAELETIEPADFEFDEDDARQAIQEDPLSVQVRSDWHSPGDDEGHDPAEFEILLCTGGPAVRIRGTLDAGEPDRCWLEYQDWGTPWTQLFGLSDEQQEALLTYCQQFYYTL